MQDVVLIVDDDDMVRTMIVEYLLDNGLNVVEAGSTEEALKHLEAHQEQICLMLTDVRMPGDQDGLELARITEANYPHIKIVVTSGLFDGSTEKMPVSADFVPKPWMPAMLNAIVNVVKSSVPKGAASD